MADSKKPFTLVILFLIFLLIVGGFGYAFWKDVSSEEEAAPAPVAAIEEAEEIIEEVRQQEPEPVLTPLPTEADIAIPDYSEDFGVSLPATSNLLRERGLGDPNAPLQVSEHSSFTCGHCGNFHRETFKQIKENYIDTGKVYLIYSDFPLNAPAVNASMIARCVPEARYFNFLQLLYDRQEDWAYEAGYMDFLKQNAQLAGLNEEQFDNCVANEELRNGLLERTREIQETHNVRSTPSFIINGERVISGAHAYQHFADVFDEELAKIEARQALENRVTEGAPTTPTE